MPRFRRPRSPVRLVRRAAAAALACLALVLALRPPPTVGTPHEPTTVPVAVARTDLAAGTVLTVDLLSTARLPPDVTPAGAADDPDELAGQVLAAPVRAGETVTDVRLVGPGLWSQVPDGQVAAPVRLADLAVARLLRAGDRVDVLSATRDDGVLDDGAGSGAPSVEVVAEDALVLTAPGVAADDGSARVPAGSGLLVLAVTPDAAQRLAAAGAGGTLTVTLGRP